jgi:hypothetical protein
MDFEHLQTHRHPWRQSHHLRMRLRLRQCGRGKCASLSQALATGRSRMPRASLAWSRWWSFPIIISICSDCPLLLCASVVGQDVWPTQCTNSVCPPVATAWRCACSALATHTLATGV